MTTPRLLALSLLTLATLLLGAQPAAAGEYCVKRGPTVVAGVVVHGGGLYCVPGP